MQGSDSRAGPGNGDSSDASPKKFYDALAPYYHLNYADWEASIQRQAEALHTILRERGVEPDASILDAACGVGTQSLGLAALGYNLTGSDVSTSAVDRARAEAADRALSIDFSVADLRRLADHHGRTFDVVIACDNAIPHLLSDREVLQALRQMYLCTAPGGTCLVSVRDYAAEDRGTPVHARPPLVHESGDARRIVFQVWSFEGDVYELSLYLIEDRAGRRPSAVVFRTRYYAVPIDRLIELMREAGYEEVTRLDEPFYQPVIVGRRPRGWEGPPPGSERGAPAEPTFRVATEGDVEALFVIRTDVLENHQSREELARIGVTPESVSRMLRTTSRAWVAEIRGEPVAFAMANAEERTVFAIFVRPGYEGEGLGRELMGRAERWLFESGAEEIWLTTGSDPELRAHGFYRALGWLEAGPAGDTETRYIKRREAPAPG